MTHAHRNTQRIGLAVVSWLGSEIKTRKMQSSKIIPQGALPQLADKRTKLTESENRFGIIRTMTTETLIMEYESEAEARGHVQRRARYGGEAASPRVMDQASRQCDRWKLPYSIFEVIEVTGDERRSLGNLDDVLADCEIALLNKWEDRLGLRRGSILPA